MKKKKTPKKTSKLVFMMLGLILLFGFFLRVYRLDKVLGFYFDQGRDALVVWDIIHKLKVPLIGPTTGIAGIFRGPFYYYLISPFYALGGGNPVFPSIFLSLTTIVAIGILFYLAKKTQNSAAGIIAAIIASCSFNIVNASRWLSNPTPMLILSMLLIYCLFRISEGKKNYWILTSFILGLSLFHFGSSGEFFYFPGVFIFGLWQHKNFPTKKIFLLSIVAFFITVAPLIFFDFKHDHILSNNIKTFLFGENSFKTSFQEVFKTRINFYYDVFRSKIFEGYYPQEDAILLVVAFSFLLFLKRFLKNKYAKIIMLILISPLIGLLFFQGNEGNVYDYYLTGYYLIFILLFGVLLGEIWHYKIGKLFVFFFLYVFLTSNLNVLMSRLSDGLDGPETIALGNQKQALDWIYKDANGQKFSTDIYVPPVIPYAYNYLFKWYGGKVHGYEPSTDQISPLYTLYEIDSPHPERLVAWLDRQKGIGKVEKEQSFGGITVQKRTRIENKK